MKKRKLGTRGILMLTCMSIMIVSVFITAFIGLMGVDKMNENGIQNYDGAMNDGYNNEIKTQVQTVISLISHYYQLSESGKITEEEAKEQALEAVRNMRYGVDYDKDGVNDGYFWIDSTDYTLVMHPILTEQEGDNRKEIKDQNGVYILQNIMKTAEKGGGFNEFYFTKSDGKTIAPKVAYSEEFKPWNWVITTGNYVDDMRSQLKDTSHNMDAILERISLQLMIAVAVMLVVAVFVCWGATKAILRPIIALKENLVKFSQGDVDFEVNKKALRCSDEIGILAESLEKVRDVMKQIVEEIKKSSHAIVETGKVIKQSSGDSKESSDEMANAIRNISDGAVAQAEGTQSAADQIEVMDEMIAKMNEKIQAMDQLSREMYEAGNNAGVIMTELEHRNDTTKGAIHNVAEQIEKTNASVQQIKECTQLIAQIAEETNLLSLNASIEAARAGEAGKGFAVVADQIKQLADESQASTITIEEIVDNLLKESAEMVSTMGVLDVETKEQQSKLDETKSKFAEVSDKIELTQSNIHAVFQSANVCHEAADKVNEVITSLSAISQQNAASTEQTSASVVEMNENIKKLSQYASELDEISDELLQTMSFFN